jgi:hypothetical protein
MPKRALMKEYQEECRKAKQRSTKFGAVMNPHWTPFFLEPLSRDCGPIPSKGSSLVWFVMS